jgi:hypothetical protein
VFQVFWKKHDEENRTRETSALSMQKPDLTSKIVRQTTQTLLDSQTNYQMGSRPSQERQADNLIASQDATADVPRIAESAVPASKKKKKKNTIKKGDTDADDDLDNICKVCFENAIDTVILECGHQVICSKCSLDIGSLCPLCRSPIARIIKTYAIK